MTSTCGSLTLKAIFLLTAQGVLKLLYKAVDNALLMSSIICKRGAILACVCQLTTQVGGFKSPHSVQTNQYW